MTITAANATISQLYDLQRQGDGDKHLRLSNDGKFAVKGKWYNIKKTQQKKDVLQLQENLKFLDKNNLAEKLIGQRKITVNQAIKLYEEAVSKETKIKWIDSDRGSQELETLDHYDRELQKLGDRQEGVHEFRAYVNELKASINQPGNPINIEEEIAYLRQGTYQLTLNHLEGKLDSYGLDLDGIQVAIADEYPNDYEVKELKEYIAYLKKLMEDKDGNNTSVQELNRFKSAVEDINKEIQILVVKHDLEVIS